MYANLQIQSICFIYRMSNKIGNPLFSFYNYIYLLFQQEDIHKKMVNHII